MMSKSSVIETDESLARILNMLDNNKNNIYLTDGTDKVLLDNGAIRLLRTNFIVKKRIWS